MELTNRSMIIIALFCMGGELSDKNKQLQKDRSREGEAGYPGKKEKALSNCIFRGSADKVIFRSCAAFPLQVPLLWCPDIP